MHRSNQIKRLGRQGQSPLLVFAAALAVSAFGPIANAEPIRPTPDTARIEILFAGYLYRSGEIQWYRREIFAQLDSLREAAAEAALTRLRLVHKWVITHDAHTDGLEPLLLAYWMHVQEHGSVSQQVEVGEIVTSLSGRWRFGQLFPGYFMPIFDPGSLIVIDQRADLVRGMLQDLLHGISVGEKPSLADLLAGRSPCNFPEPFGEAGEIQQPAESIKIGPDLDLTGGQCGGGGGGGGVGSGKGGGSVSGGACLSGQALRGILRRQIGDLANYNGNYLSDLLTCMNSNNLGFATNPVADGSGDAWGALASVMVQYLKSEGDHEERIFEAATHGFDALNDHVKSFLKHKRQMERDAVAHERMTAAEAAAAEKKRRQFEGLLGITVGFLGADQKLVDNATDNMHSAEERAVEEDAARAMKQAEADDASAGTPESRAEAAKRAEEHRKVMKDAEESAKWWSDFIGKKVREMKKSVLDLHKAVFGGSDKNDINEFARPAPSVQAACTRLFGLDGGNGIVSISRDRPVDPRLSDPDEGSSAFILDSGILEICGSDWTTNYGSTGCSASKVMMCADEESCGCSEPDEEAAKELVAKAAAASCGMIICPDTQSPTIQGVFCTCGGSKRSGGGLPPKPVMDWNTLKLIFQGRPADLKATPVQ